MPNKAYVMPDKFVFSAASRERVKAEFKITDAEVERVLKEIREWEFAVARSDWNRVTLRWFRESNKRGDLQRPQSARKYTNTIHGQPSTAERAEDQRKFDEMVKGLRVVK